MNGIWLDHKKVSEGFDPGRIRTSYAEFFSISAGFHKKGNGPPRLHGNVSLGPNELNAYSAFAFRLPLLWPVSIISSDLFRNRPVFAISTSRVRFGIIVRQAERDQQREFQFVRAPDCILKCVIARRALRLLHPVKHIITASDCQPI